MTTRYEEGENSNILGRAVLGVGITPGQVGVDNVLLYKLIVNCVCERGREVRRDQMFYRTNPLATWFISGERENLITCFIK